MDYNNIFRFVCFRLFASAAMAAAASAIEIHIFRSLLEREATARTDFYYEIIGETQCPAIASLARRFQRKVLPVLGQPCVSGNPENAPDSRVSRQRLRDAAAAISVCFSQSVCCAVARRRRCSSILITSGLRGVRERIRDPKC